MLHHGPRSAPPDWRPLKKKGFKEERVTTIGLYAIGTSTTLESSKSHAPNRCTGCASRSAGTATQCSVAPTAIPAALRFSCSHCAALTRLARRFCCWPLPARRVACAISWSSLRTMSSSIGCGGRTQAFFQTGAHAQGVCHHCCRRIPRDHARKRVQDTTVLTAFDTPMPLSLQYAQGGRDDKLLPAVRDHWSLRCSQPVN